MSERILTSNWHESYLHLMAKTGYLFDVILKEKGGVYGWMRQIRPVPENVRLITDEEARSGLASGFYAAVVGHNLTDLVFASAFEAVPKIMVFHNKLTTEILLGKRPLDRDAYMKQVTTLFETAGNAAAVFISESKRRDWGLPGEILLPGIDLDEYGGYEGADPKVLRVGNLLMERDIMLGYSLQERLCAGLASTILGLNPRIPEAVLPPDWDDFRSQLRQHRLYLNTTQDPYEDGYNLAMLEAMATGMPVVSGAHPSSPLTDGHDGYVSPDEGCLRERIVALLRDRDLSRTLGRRARETVADRFPLQRFLARWRETIEGARTAAGSTRRGLPGARVAVGLPSVEAPAGPAGIRGCATDLPAYYRNEREEVAALVEETAARILDVGCGGGRLGRRLKAASSTREVWGVEVLPEAAREAGKWLDHVAVADASRWEPPVGEGYFDTIIFADVLEHFPEPAEVLGHYLRWLAPAGRVVLSLPNVRYWGVARNLVEGNWTYQDEGILDRGHLRFFTRNELVRLLDRCGLEVLRISSNRDPRCPEIPEGQTVDLDLGRFVVRDLSASEAREFFDFQYLVIAVRKRAWLKARAKRLAAEGNASEAFSLYAHLHDRYPEEHAFLAGMAESARGGEERRRTIQCLERYLGVHPAHVDSLLAAARLLMEERRFREARARLDRILLFLPDHAEARTRLQSMPPPDETSERGEEKKATQST